MGFCFYQSQQIEVTEPQTLSARSLPRMDPTRSSRAGPNPLRPFRTVLGQSHPMDVTILFPMVPYLRTIQTTRLVQLLLSAPTPWPCPRIINLLRPTPTGLGPPRLSPTFPGPLHLFPMVPNLFHLFPKVPNPIRPFPMVLNPLHPYQTDLSTRTTQPTRRARLLPSTPTM